MIKFIFTRLLTPTQWENFRSNRRAYFSLYIFTSLFVFSWGAEFIFNEKPLLIKYKNNYYFPVVKAYPETIFDGFFETETVYQDPFVSDQIKQHGYIIWAPFPYYYDTIIKNPESQIPSPPSWKHWLGIDDQSRDILSRVVYGFRLSVFFALILSTISLVVGITAGLIQGYFGGLTDIILQRFLEIWDSIPILYLLIILTTVIIPDFWWLLFITSCFGWMSYVGIVRAEVLRVRNFDYVRSARALGASNIRIMMKHILPNALVATLTFLPFNMSGAIITLASLDFLGLGLPASSPSLGELIFQGKKNLHAPWLGITGFTVTASILIMLIFIGEGIRDCLDPHKSNSLKSPLKKKL